MLNNVFLQLLVNLFPPLRTWLMKWCAGKYNSQIKVLKSKLNALTKCKYPKKNKLL